MSKAGKKLLNGAAEVLAIAKGKKMPAKVTRFAYMIWSPTFGIFGIPRDTPKQAKVYALKNERVVRVRITTVAEPKKKPPARASQGAGR